ncbi:hypothetical protein GP486_000871 [Trichoglossum hirsutum]|uniref:FAD-binding PCMH-type domain-containing protein n=1 Tax=Trichoglossum hirsutum TaxID=265104 RepID=A0A9P8LI79_9PEZI|nr:hypothetical protein GP486_000871 [Trichoglossum hirsutum]
MAISAELIDELRASLKGGSEVFLPGEEGYQSGVKRWSEYSEKAAGAVVAANSTPDISATVVFSATNSIELAIVGGGHSTGGSSSTDGGIVLDLSLLRGVTVDPTAKTIAVQGGALWADVDAAASEHGLATVAGTVNHTGVGGLTLGGGWGWLTPRHGNVVDNLLSVTMVLADGSVVQASETENPNLFWAIRGAGSNFGVAVEFVYRAHEQRQDVWAGLMVFPTEKLSAVVEFANSVTGVEDAAMSFGFSAPPPLNSPAVLAAVFYNGPEEKATEIFAPLIAHNPLMNSAGSIPYKTLNGMLNSAVTHGDRKTAKGSSFTMPVSPEFAQSVLDHFSAFVSRVPDTNQTLILFECIDPTKLFTVAQSATAFANRGKYMNSVVVPRWISPEYDYECREYAREFDRLFRAERERKEGAVTHKSGVGQYSNYSETFASAKEIYGENYERLVELKMKFDPGNVFSKWHPIVPQIKVQN